jgi:hypothetical protein
MSRWFKAFFITVAVAVFLYLILGTALEHSTRLAEQEAAVVRHMTSIVKGNCVRFEHTESGAIAVLAAPKNPIEGHYMLEYRIDSSSQTFTITAVPRDWSKNFRSFFIDSATARLRYEGGKRATADSRLVE